MPEAYPNPPRQALPEPPASPPAILAAGGLELPSLAGTAGAHVDGQILLGVTVTAVAAYLFVRFLLRSFQTRALTPFAIYCLALGHSASSASPYDPGQAPDRDRGSGGRAGHEGGRHGFARIRVGAATGTCVSARPGWRAAPGCGTASRGGERTTSESTSRCRDFISGMSGRGGDPARSLIWAHFWPSLADRRGRSTATPAGQDPKARERGGA